ncbi:MAG TPA: hypothetical protein VMF30_09540 [Pirellulales bacterium]|nr:hypothetical protein [Pirellulales bacterium]
MATTQFDRASMARWYAEQHLKTDPGIVSVYYLPANSDVREIRFVEVNRLIGDRTDDALEPVDFGVDFGEEGAHKLFVVDVSPAQWERIQAGNLRLPDSWSLTGALELP